ncbi:MAG: SRPBCC domain-containing protein [Rhodospirillales bacterium]|nr:SRPBCC domain-containing protein [Rhodospirillales bacterium]MBO6787525.1 SRPBCC domain-containing protein [Rhodospirillales bacterium]
MDANTDVSNRVLTIERTFNAPRALVFKMWTQPEHMARWWGCGYMKHIEVSADLRVGGQFRAAMTLDDDSSHVIVGKYLEIDQPTHLSFTWWVENGAAGSETVVTIDLSEDGGKTHMSFRHGTFDEADMCAGHGEGWTVSFDRLEALFNASAKQ